MRNFSDKSC